jgi:hypothetical protein
MLKRGPGLRRSATLAATNTIDRGTKNLERRRKDIAESLAATERREKRKEDR